MNPAYLTVARVVMFTSLWAGAAAGVLAACHGVAWYFSVAIGFGVNVVVGLLAGLLATIYLAGCYLLSNRSRSATTGGAPKASGVDSYAAADPHKTGIKSARSFSLGDYQLDMPLPLRGSLTGLTDGEYQSFRRYFEGEIICHAPPTRFLGRDWAMMVGIVGDEPYKLAASLELDSPREGKQVAQSALAFCETQLGTPPEQWQGVFVWDKVDGNVILQTGPVLDGFAVNIFVTSNRIGGKRIRDILARR